MKWLRYEGEVRASIGDREFGVLRPASGYLIEDEGGGVVAFVPASSNADVNSALVVAAPDLQEALRDLSVGVAGYECWCRLDPQPGGHDRRCLAAQAAIAKAETP